MDQIPLPKDPPIEAQAQEQPELSWQINSHVVVLDEENPTTSVPTETQGVAQPRVELTPPITSEIPSTNPIVPQDPTI